MFHIKELEALVPFLDAIGQSHIHFRLLSFHRYPKDPNVLYKLIDLDVLFFGPLPYD